MTYLVGVDCGTQSAKVVIYDASGRPVSQGRQPLRPMVSERPGAAVHPDDDIWTAIGIASRAAMAGFHGDPAEIAGVGICAIRCCKTFLDADGELIEPVVSWMDERSSKPYVPTSPSLAYATTLSGYVAHRFTGHFADTVGDNIASQWPTDTDAWDWSGDPAVLASFGLRRDQLFDLVQPGDVLGALTTAAAAHTGFPAGIPVVATSNDKAVEMLGNGALGSGSVLVSLGTYIAAMVHGDRNLSVNNSWTNFSSVPGRYLYESAGIRRGMWTVTWFLDLLGPEFANAARASGLSREQYLEREAVEVAPGSDGLLTVLDWLATPAQPFRKGAMLGFDGRHGRAHIYRSILEAIALTMKANVDAMVGELGFAVERLALSGGGASSPLFTQIFADVFGVPTICRRFGGASLGAAICAAAATGVHPSIDDAAVAMAAPFDECRPDATNTTRYASVLDTVYRDIRTHTDPHFERAFPIFH